MARGGYRPGAGRPKGSKNKAAKLPERPPAAAPLAASVNDFREWVRRFREEKLDALTREVWETGSLREKIEWARFILPFEVGVPKHAASLEKGQTPEDILEGIAKRRAIESA